MECKVTEKASYALGYLDLEKLRKQAIKALESPVFQFAYRHPSGRMTKFAVIPWQVGDKPKETDHSWFTSARSIALTEDELEQALRTGRIQFSFLMPGTDPFEKRIFEIMRWDDFIDRQGADA